MKKILCLGFGLLATLQVIAQCGSAVAGGSGSTLLFGPSRGCLNPVVADKDLNTVAFIHRTNTLSIGNMGNMVYDISTNGGSSWTTNSAILNTLAPSYARFPNLTLYNPASNTNPSNAYLGYMAATVNSNTSVYNGVVSGVRQIGGTATTENYNQPVSGSSFIPGAVVKGAPGVFWSIDALYNGTYITGFTVYKGVWSSSSNDIVWSNNFSVSPSFNMGLTSTGAIPADYNIAFDPTGTTGYFSFLGHLSTGPTAYSYYPVLYKTTNGGTSWTGPIIVDITQFSCFTSNVSIGNVASTNFEHDLAVDVNGNPHLITCLLNGNNAYAVYYGLWHHMFDLTLKNGLWAAYDLGNVNTGRATYGTIPNNASQDIFPRIARTADGTKIFFTWTDNSSYVPGVANLTPNLFSKAYNVATDSWTPLRDYTSCNPATDGKMVFPHLAPEVLEPGSGSYKLAVVYSEFTSTVTTPADPFQPINYKFLDNVTYALSDFSITTPPAVVTITPGPTATLCPGSTITIGTATNTGQFIWSTGATTPSIGITTGTATSYSVVAQQGCNVGTASITVVNMTVNATASSTDICPGSSATFSISGNAASYLWMPGNYTGPSATIAPTTNTVTVSSLGSGGCTNVQTININLLTLPTLSVAGSSSICAGSVISKTVSGAQTYSWSNGSSSATFTDAPSTNTLYVITGTAVNTCTASITTSVSVKPTPTVNIAATQTAICMGQTISMNGQGAATYTWDAVNSGTTITVNPSVTTIYTLTGAGTNLCLNSRTISITVFALPSITVTPSRPTFCKGEKIALKATGAITYTWVSPALLNASVQVQPTVTTTYSLSGTSSDGCVNTKTYVLTVNPCLGLEELSNSNAMLIYPNPNNGTFTIKTEKKMDLQLVNELGQLVRTLLSNEENAQEIFVDGLPTGIYFVLGRNEEMLIKQKVLITR